MVQSIAKGDALQFAFLISIDTHSEKVELVR